MEDSYYMKLALELAKSTVGQTSPNPVVGSVVVKDGEVVGLGAHLKAGQPHAEVHAIRMAKEKVEGATIYVTLEPCSHYGRTPPCADLIIKSKIKRVVIATTDPNPMVAGKGIEKMERAGIDVKLGILKDQADELNKIFFYYIRTKRPFVTIKNATSLDGKIATEIGESKWITSEHAREDVHYYRNSHDAILVGINTVLKDNPSLTTRLKNGGRNPIRVILDTHLKTPLSARIVNDHEAETWIVTGNQVSKEEIRKIESPFVKVIQLTHSKIIIDELLDYLGSQGITSLFVEGGAKVNGSFLRAKAINQVITYIAPKLIGGENAPTSFLGKGIPVLNNAFSMEFKCFEKIGEDLKIVAVPKEVNDSVYGDY